MSLRVVETGLNHRDAARLVEAVQAEYVVLYGGPDASPMDVGQFSEPNGAFLVGYLDGEPVASVAYRLLPPLPTLPSGVCAEMKRMFVHPSMRGRHLSRQMLAAVERHAAERGVAHVVLETGSMQPAAIKLYRTSGYTDVDGTGWAEYYGHEGVVIVGKALQAETTLRNGSPAT